MGDLFKNPADWEHYWVLQGSRPSTCGFRYPRLSVSSYNIVLHNRFHIITNGYPAGVSSSKSAAWECHCSNLDLSLKNVLLIYCILFTMYTSKVVTFCPMLISPLLLHKFTQWISMISYWQFTKCAFRHSLWQTTVIFYEEWDFHTCVEISLKTIKLLGII